MNPIFAISLLPLACLDLFGVEVVQMPDLNGDGVHELALTDNCLSYWQDCDPSLWILSGRDQSLVSRIAVRGGAQNLRPMRTPEGMCILTVSRGGLGTYAVSSGSSRTLDVAYGRGRPVIVIPDITNDGFDDLVAVRDLAVGREVVALSGVDLALLWQQPLSGMPGHCSMLLMPRREGDAFGNVFVAYAARPDGPPAVVIQALSSKTGEVLALGTVGVEATSVHRTVQLVPLGDLDGDGSSDVLLNLHSMFKKSSFIAVSTMASEVLFRIDAPRLKGAMASIGDVTGDHQRDLVFGAWDSVEVRSGTDGRALYTVVPEDGTWFGTGIADLGDVDDDLAADFVVTASPPGVPDEGGWFAVVSGCDGTILSRHQRDDYVTGDR